MGKSAYKELNTLFSRLGDNWTVEARKTGHYKLQHKKGDIVIVSGSPGTRGRWLRNVEADIRRVERKYINV